MNPFQRCGRKIVTTHARKNVRRDVCDSEGWWRLQVGSCDVLSVFVSLTSLTSFEVSSVSASHRRHHRQFFGFWLLTLMYGGCMGMLYSWGWGRYGSWIRMDTQWYKMIGTRMMEGNQTRSVKIDDRDMLIGAEWCLFSDSQPTWQVIQTTACMAQSKNFSGAWQQRSTGEGQRCMLRIMWVTWALETILLLGFSCCTLSIVVMWCASRILTIQIHISKHIHTYVDGMNGMASPCQAPTGTVDLLSGGEATVTAVPTPEVTKVAEAARKSAGNGRGLWRFIDVYGRKSFKILYFK